MTAEIALRGYLTVLGAVALVAGVWAALTGVGGMAGDNVASVNVDSELRFFGGIWAAYGVACLWTSRRVAAQPVAVRLLALALFAAGLARLVSWADAGRPDAVYLVLLALELATPPLALLAQRRLPRG